MDKQLQLLNSKSEVTEDDLKSMHDLIPEGHMLQKSDSIQICNGFPIYHTEWEIIRSDINFDNDEPITTLMPKPSAPEIDEPELCPRYQFTAMMENHQSQLVEIDEPELCPRYQFAAMMEKLRKQ